MPGAIRLVVGLGNPGERYEGTRHNVGFRVADRLGGDSARWKREGDGLCLRLDSVWVVKPMTYMNESGRFVRDFSSFHKISPTDILIVSDDMDLPLGRLRIRMKGSSGGQNGLGSVLESLGTDEVPRLRLGIGPRPERVDAVGFVLGRFKDEETGPAEVMVGKAADAVRAMVAEGLEAAMNRYNAA